FKECGSDMEVAKKTDVIFLSNFSYIAQGHTLINCNAVCAASCHLTDDSYALSSSPQTGCFACTVDDLPRCLHIGKDILPEIGWLQHRGRGVIDGNNVAADNLRIDACRDCTDLACIGEETSGQIGIAEE